MKRFFKTDESVIMTQRAFHAHFMLCQNDAALDGKWIMLWVKNFRVTGSTLKRKPWVMKNFRNRLLQCMTNKRLTFFGWMSFLKPSD